MGFMASKHPIRNGAKRPHIVGSIVTLQGADGKPFKYLWKRDQSKYTGAKLRELNKTRSADSVAASNA